MSQHPDEDSLMSDGSEIVPNHENMDIFEDGDGGDGGGPSTYEVPPRDLNTISEEAATWLLLLAGPQLLQDAIAQGAEEAPIHVSALITVPGDEDPEQGLPHIVAPVAVGIVTHPPVLQLQEMDTEYQNFRFGPKGPPLTQEMYLHGGLRTYPRNPEFLENRRQPVPVHTKCIRCAANNTECRAVQGQARCQCCIEYFQRLGPDDKDRFPCLRLSVTDVSLFRADNYAYCLEASLRWRQPDLREFEGAWGYNRTELVHVDRHIGNRPAFHVEARPYIPRTGDVGTYEWVDDGLIKQQDLAPAAIVDVAQTAFRFAHYIASEAPSALAEAAVSTDPLTNMTFNYAAGQLRSLADRGMESDRQFSLLAQSIQIRFAIENAVATPCLRGDEALGMYAEDEDESCPMFDLVPVPPMMQAQLDNINIVAVMQPLRARILQALEEIIFGETHNSFISVYCSIYILLVSISSVMRERAVDGVEDEPTMEYETPGFVADLRDSANTLLAMWHWYMRGVDPMDIGLRQITPLANLTPYEMADWESITAWVSHDAQRMNQYRERRVMDSHFYWVYQMFDKQWSPLEAPPVPGIQN